MGHTEQHFPVTPYPVPDLVLVTQSHTWAVNSLFEQGGSVLMMMMTEVSKGEKGKWAVIIISRMNNYYLTFSNYAIIIIIIIYYNSIECYTSRFWTDVISTGLPLSLIIANSCKVNLFTSFPLMNTPAYIRHCCSLQCTCVRKKLTIPGGEEDYSELQLLLLGY